MSRLSRWLLVGLALVVAFTSLGLSNYKGFAQTTETEQLFTVLHTNDEHSALLPSPLVDYDPTTSNPSRGGFARLAQAVKEIRTAKQAAGEPVLLVSGGDYLSGSPFAWLALDQKAAELSLMIELGYDVITIGNHEYDYGPDILASYLQTAGYPQIADQMAIVASNTVIPSEHPLAEVGIKSTHIKTLPNGLKLGFFGLIGKDAISVAPYATPITFADQVETARLAVAQLQAAQVDVIIALTHAGEYEDMDLARAVPGIHLIVGGHTHSSLSAPISVGETLIVQSGSSLARLGLVELAFNPTTGKLRLRNEETGQPYLLPLDENIGYDPDFLAAVSVYEQHLNAQISRLTEGRFTSISQAIVRSEFPVPNKPALQESPFGNFVTDAMRIMGEQVTGEKVDFAIQANGVIRGAIQPGTLPGTKGQVALFDLVNLVGLGLGPDLQPGYPMVSVYFTGEEVRRIMEVSVLLSELMGDTYFLQFSGARLTYDPKRAILATIPVKNLPIPTGRAVLSAERFTGTGVQWEDSFTELKRGDQQLYHVISDHYLAAFLPMVGEKMSSLGIVMKNKDGEPISADEAIVYSNGQEYKVWEAVVEYAASLPVANSGLPSIPNYYALTAERIVQVSTLPIWLWPTGGALLIVALLAYLIRQRKQRRNQLVN